MAKKPPAKVAASSKGKLVVSEPAEFEMAWVVLAEMPSPAGDFFDHPVKRAFIEDEVEVRVRIKNLVLEDTDQVSIFVKEHDLGLNPDDFLSLVTSSAGKAAAFKGEVGSEQRPLEPVADVAAASQADSKSKILFQVDAAKKETLLQTTVRLPADPSDWESNDLEYYFTVEIGTKKRVQKSEESPTLEGIRWWAKPSQNLEYKKTDATSITPLIDGEDFFAAVLAAMNGASKHIYIASWSLWLDTLLSGQPGPGGDKLSDVINAAASRGVKVHILLDSHNGGWAAPILNKFLTHANIMVKISAHPKKIPIQGSQNGSYHEKYVCVDTKEAIVGGIDFMPDRYQDSTHSWKSDHKKFKAQVIARAVPMALFSSEFMLWHDVGVSVEGPIVHDVEVDFARRWNAGDPSGHDIKPPTRASVRPTANVQLVKTDLVPGRVYGHNDQLGTLDIYRQAILGARHFIYIENQYLNYPALATMLYQALDKNPELQLFAVVPFRTEEMMTAGATAPARQYWYESGALSADNIRRHAYWHMDYLQSELIKKVRSVDKAADRVGVYVLAGCVGGANPQQIYPHSKIMVVDDTWAIIGSANTNGRSFKTDAEIGIAIHDRETVTTFRRALWKEHLGVDMPTTDIRDFATTWKAKEIKGKKSPADCTCGEVATVHAVALENPPEGKKYDGPLSSVMNIDDNV